MKAATSLRRLLKLTGPIPGFTIKTGHKLAAYTEISIRQRTYTSRRRGGGVADKTQVRVMNREIFHANIESESFARAAAMRDGRIECTSLGEVDEIEAGRVIVRMARNAKIRNKYREEIRKVLYQYKILLGERRAALAKAEALARLARPDPDAPETLGWRAWSWDPAIKRLRSPSYRETIWYTPEMRAENWKDAGGVRGHGGIHAARMPIDWRRASVNGTELNGYGEIIGVVERFGNFVLGTMGWRAEWVIIRSLRAPNSRIGLELERAYPDVEVYYDQE